jgi:hypothetical protein
MDKELKKTLDDIGKLIAMHTNFSRLILTEIRDIRRNLEDGNIERCGPRSNQKRRGE